jgi:hypothetical protein
MKFIPGYTIFLVELLKVMRLRISILSLERQQTEFNEVDGQLLV